MARVRLAALGLCLLLTAAGLAYAATTDSRASSQANGPSCPVTLPNHPVHPPFGVSGKLGYRQGQLATELWPLGVTLVNKRDVMADGLLGVKVGWYRYGRGRLRITATRIDKPGRVTRTSVPAGYGRTGFQASGIYFPSTGCWKVTGTVGHSHLTYVTVVLEVFVLRGRVLE
jgi:hypothetical protein